MQIVKPNKGSDCYRCPERINSGELRFKTKAGYMHLHCKKILNELGIGNYCYKTTLIFYFFKSKKVNHDEMVRATRLEF